MKPIEAEAGIDKAQSNAIIPVTIEEATTDLGTAVAMPIAQEVDASQHMRGNHIRQ